MKKSRSRIISAFFIFAIFTLAIFMSNKKIGPELTKEQSEWIEDNKHKTFKFSTELRENCGLFDTKEGYRGFYLSFLKQLKKDTGLNIEFTNDDDEEVDLKGGIDNAESIEKNYILSESLKTQEYVVYTTKPKQIDDMFDLRKATVGVLEIDSISTAFEKHHPMVSIKKYTYKNEKKLFEAVKNKEIDTVIIPFKGKEIILDKKTELSYIFNMNKLKKSFLFISDIKNKELIEIINKELAYLKDSKKLSEIISEEHDEFLKERIFESFTEKEKKWVEENKELKVWLPKENLPFSYFDGKTHYGIDVEVLRHVGKILDIDIKFRSDDIEDAVSLLESKEVDLIGGTKLKMDASKIVFTESYATASYKIYGQVSAKAIRDFYNVSASKLMIPYNSNLSLSLRILMPRAEVTKASTHSEIIEKLLDGTVEYGIMPDLVFGYYNKQSDKNHIIEKGIYNKNVSYFFTSLKENKTFTDIFDKIVVRENVEDLMANGMASIPNEDKTKELLRITIIMLVLLGMVLLIMYGRYYIAKKDKLKMKYTFEHDTLTNLPNKYGIEDIFKEKIKNKKEVCSLIVIDIDDFKKINDKFGHNRGDEIILSVAKILKSYKSEKVFVGRTGGDEFALVIKEADVKKLSEFAFDIKNKINDYFYKNSLVSYSDVSMGIACYPEHTKEFEDLYKYAEDALYHRKKKHGKKGFTFFSKELYDSYLDEVSLTKDLMEAIKKDEIELYLQPQVKLPKEELIGAEVLVRWNHKERGTIYPDVFIPLAEKSGIMGKLDMHILEKSCDLIKKWKNEYNKKLKLSINMSTTTLTGFDVENTLKKIIKDKNINPKYVVIEITEDIGLDDLKEARKRLMKIKSTGVRIALDDFGKGYSSLIYLEKLPIDILKIDREFIEEIHLRENPRQIYKFINDLAKGLKLEVVVEGVENKEQLKILKNISDTIIQGYYYGKPMKKEIFEEKFKL